VRRRSARRLAAGRRERSSLVCCCCCTALRISSSCTALHPACEHVPPYRHPLTCAWFGGGEPLGHTPTHTHTHTRPPSERASLTWLPAHPGNETTVCQPASLRWCTAPETALTHRASALCRSARSRPTLRLNAHCRPTASARGAVVASSEQCRLVLGRALTADCWTPRCSEPGYGGVGVTVHPACDPSQPSVAQSDGLLCLHCARPPYRRRSPTCSYCSLYVECLHAAPAGKSLTTSESPTTGRRPRESHTPGMRYIDSARRQPRCGKRRAKRALTGIGRGGAKVDTACHGGRLSFSIALGRRINRRQHQRPDEPALAER
jgi:hypothetical protein